MSEPIRTQSESCVLTHDDGTTECYVQLSQRLLTALIEGDSFLLDLPPLGPDVVLGAIDADPQRQPDRVLQLAGKLSLHAFRAGRKLGVLVMAGYDFRRKLYDAPHVRLPREFFAPSIARQIRDIWLVRGETHEELEQGVRRIQALGQVPPQPPSPFETVRVLFVNYTISGGDVVGETVYGAAIDVAGQVTVYIGVTSSVVRSLQNTRRIFVCQVEMPAPNDEAVMVCLVSDVVANDYHSANTVMQAADRPHLSAILLAGLDGSQRAALLQGELVSVPDTDVAEYLGPSGIHHVRVFQADSREQFWEQMQTHRPENVDRMQLSVALIAHYQQQHAQGDS